MKLNPAQRAAVRSMFGGFCAYCGKELGVKWHADHVEPVKRDGDFVLKPGAKFATWKCNGKFRAGHNDRIDNFFPACVKCNILKSTSTIEEFRQNLSYFAKSIPAIRTYSHVHHLMRFGKLTIDESPIVFWFEKYQAPHTAGSKQ